MSRLKIQLSCLYRSFGNYANCRDQVTRSERIISENQIRFSAESHDQFNEIVLACGNRGSWKKHLKIKGPRPFI